MTSTSSPGLPTRASTVGASDVSREVAAHVARGRGRPDTGSHRFHRWRPRYGRLCVSHSFCRPRRSRRGAHRLGRVLRPPLAEDELTKRLGTLLLPAFYKHMTTRRPCAPALAPGPIGP